MAYAGMKPEQDNQLLGVMNLIRNIGGSVGISLTGAIVAERAQFHQAQLAQIATSYNPHMQSSVQSLANILAQASALPMRCVSLRSHL